MASIHKEILIQARPQDVWAAIRDVGAVHQRLAPGFVIDARLDGDARIVTFANVLWFASCSSTLTTRLDGWPMQQ